MITLYTFGPHFGLPDPSPFVIKSLVHLKMSGLPFDVAVGDLRKSPKGKLPFMRDGEAVVADSVFIQKHLESHYGIDLNQGLTSEQRAVGWAFEKLCEDHLYWAMVDARWSVAANFDKGPRRFFDPVPAPLRPLILGLVRRRLQRNLLGQGFGRHARAEIEQLAALDLDALAAYLGDKDYLFGAAPHAADAAVYGTIAGVMCPLFETPIRAAANRHANLVAYEARGRARWFPDLV
jgi:glutathione S-transferase